MAHVDKAEEILIVGNYVIPALVKPRKESLSQALQCNPARLTRSQRLSFTTAFEIQCAVINKQYNIARFLENMFK